MSGYALHPEAFADIDEIWEYIAEDNLEAADGVVTEILGRPYTRCVPAYRSPTA